MPTIDAEDAVDMCAEPYPTRREALGVARRLRAAGWVVREVNAPLIRDGIEKVAVVLHPTTYDSPGDVNAYSRHDPGG